MKPGKRCKGCGKRCYASREDAVKQGMKAFFDSMIKLFAAYRCEDCKCWHLTTHLPREPRFGDDRKTRPVTAMLHVRD